MDFRQFVFSFFLLYMKIKGTGEGAELHLTGCRTNRWQLLLQRDLFLQEQHLHIPVVTQTPILAIFICRCFVMFLPPPPRPNSTTAIIPTPRSVLIYATKHHFGWIFTVQVSRCHSSPWPGTSLSCSDHEHKQRGEAEQKILPIFHTFKCGHCEQSLRASHRCSHARNP